MALSTQARQSLAGLWGGYDFYLIRDHHFKTASDMIERFLEKYQPLWSKSPRPTDAEFARNPKEVRGLLSDEIYAADDRCHEPSSSADRT